MTALRVLLVSVAALAFAQACPARPSAEPARRVSGPNPALPGLGAGDEALAKRLGAALAAKGSAYEPRTHHKRADGSPKFTNRLVLETSPYLLQHAHNPVNWFAWSDDAFARARAEDKPVLLSVGYSTCHWCHVMERESFEDEEIAAFMNEHFIAIKVDREERPDVDDVYMTATNMLTGRGGWPMTVVMTADKQPFFAGTYFPARDGDRGSSKGFFGILRELQARYRDGRAELVAHAAEVSRRIARASATAPTTPSLPAADAIEAAAAMNLAAFDSENGGFGRAPKFPRPVVLQLLLRYHRRSGDAKALAAVVRTLERMHAGGVYDHVAGGFHRYSTDARWLVPHFEKMLYDNAQLAAIYVEAFQVTHKAEYARVARDVLDYVDREMSDARGGFHSATDADSKTPGGHEEEGWFFTWTAGEIDGALGPERGELVRTYFGVSARGNFEGRNILFLPRTHEEAAALLKMKPGEVRAEIDGARELLRSARASRPPPHKDDKVLTSWNALAISAFARAGFALDEPRYVARAKRAAEFLLEHHRTKDGALLRSSRGGAAQIDGYLDDYAFLISALLDLFEATGEERWLTTALDLQRRLDAEFADEAGGYFMTGKRHEALLARQKPDYDGAEPSGNSIAAENLARLAELTLDDAHRQKAERTIAALAKSAAGAPRLLCGLDFLLDDAREIVVVTPDAAAAKPLLDVVRATFLPNRVLAIVASGAPSTLALAEGKALRDAKPTAYVCERGRCELPTSDPQVLARQLSAVKPLRTEREAR